MPATATYLLSVVLLLSGNGTSPAQLTRELQAAGPKQNESGTSNEAKTNSSTGDPSDVRIGNLEPYLKKVMERVKANWYKQIPAVAQSPTLKRGTVWLESRVTTDGIIDDVQYVESSGYTALDRAAYQAIADSNPVPPLPINLVCPSLEIRFPFTYNLRSGEALRDTDALSALPCVTTPIRSTTRVSIIVFPNPARVVTGRQQQFLAMGKITGELDSAVIWSVGGPGCAASDCGVISAKDSTPRPLRFRILRR